MTIIAEMAAIIKGHFTNYVSVEQEYVRDMLKQNKTSKTLQELLEQPIKSHCGKWSQNANRAR